MLQSENVSIKDLQNQRVMLPILEYHNKNWTWTDMLMEVKKDYKNAIISQVHVHRQSLNFMANSEGKVGGA